MKKTIIMGMLVILMCTVAQPVFGKSIYAITDHGFPARLAKITAYEIQEDQIEFQVVNEMDQQVYPTGAGLGPVGLAVDSESEYLFVTHESMASYGVIKGIQLINAKTMVDEGLC